MPPMTRAEMDFYASFDEQRDAVFSLQMVSELLKKTEEDLQYWKWVIIALHSALQGFMVLALKGSDGLGVIQEGNIEGNGINPNCGSQAARKKKKSRSRWGTRREWTLFLWDWDTNPQPKPPKLMSFLDLYDAIQSPDCMHRFVNTRVFEASESQTESVGILNDQLRNEFIHFLPKTNMIPIINLLLVVSDCIEIISFLAFDSNNILWYPEELESKTGELITRTKEQAQSLEKTINSEHGWGNRKPSET
jgi:hypothetical protein